MTSPGEHNGPHRRSLVWANPRVTFTRFALGGVLVAIIVAVLPSVSADPPVDDTIDKVIEAFNSRIDTSGL